MSRTAATSVENSFRQGLITEASGLNFPENSCTETFDCVFNYDGMVERRPGFDFENGFTTKNIDRNNSVVTSYYWRNVAGNGDVSVLVVQVGATLYFYETSTTGSLSAGAVSSTVNLATYSASGAPTPETVECQFASGNGVLFVTHPYCETIYVSYDNATSTATATQIDIKIRDLTGDTADSLAVDTRPTATLAGLDVHHKYNLYNQGWNTTNLTAWDTAATTMPSNVDVMWQFKNASDAFDMTTLPNVIRGNSKAPLGHFILGVHDQDRDAAAGTSGATTTTTGFQRCSTSAFFAGRVFYSGINYVGFNAKIYFSQIIERPEQYGFCYQSNDPTAEDAFDLLPSDGGVISINDAGTIYKLITIAGGLVVFAQNGVWFISGSTGLGFTANDWTAAKISSITTLSASSFVDVGGTPAWWNSDGIYMLMPGEGGAPAVKPLTYNTIKTTYDEIPLGSKTNAKGFFNPTSGVIQWLYKTEDGTSPTENYEFDRILNFNTFTGAFYFWRMPEADVTIQSMLVLPSDAGATQVSDVIDAAAETVVDGSGATVVAFTTATTVRETSFKYLVSYANGSTYTFTFADATNENYVDWFQYDAVGVEYESYFISGYKIHGQGLLKFQPLWVTIFSKTETPVSYHFQSIWNYANTGNTGRWSSRQLVAHDNLDYDYTARRLKVRGSGIVLQFKVSSVSGKAFKIAGWAMYETGNQKP